MSSRRRRWLSVIGAVLVTGFVVTSLVEADDDKHKNPFTQILHKLDQILSKLNSGGGDGHHTLRWDQALPAAQRFVVLASFNNAAVLDRETGLVWEQSPDTTTTDWVSARHICIEKNVGGRKGWRLPAIAELTSLIDPSVSQLGLITLPAGHPFSNVQLSAYWSASAAAGGESGPWHVLFSTGTVRADSNPHPTRVWCVRGGMSADAY